MRAPRWCTSSARPAWRCSCPSRIPALGRSTPIRSHGACGSLSVRRSCCFSTSSQACSWPGRRARTRHPSSSASSRTSPSSSGRSSTPATARRTSTALAIPGRGVAAHARNAAGHGPEAGDVVCDAHGERAGEHAAWVTARRRRHLGNGPATCSRGQPEHSQSLPYASTASTTRPAWPGSRLRGPSSP